MLEAAPAAAPAPAEAGEQSPAEATESPVDDEARKLRDDPIGMLAEAAGYTDHELWWEHQIEQRLDSTRSVRRHHRGDDGAARGGRAAGGPRGAARSTYAPGDPGGPKEGFERIAVVCGAWHVPALSDPQAEDDDAALLRGLQTRQGRRDLDPVDQRPPGVSQRLRRGRAVAGLVCPSVGDGPARQAGADEHSLGGARRIAAARRGSAGLVEQCDRSGAPGGCAGCPARPADAGTWPSCTSRSRRCCAAAMRCRCS